MGIIQELIERDRAELALPKIEWRPRQAQAGGSENLHALELVDGQIELRGPSGHSNKLSSTLKDPLVGMSFSEDGSLLAIASIKQLALFQVDPQSLEVTLAGRYKPYTFKHELLGRLLNLEDDIPRLMNSVAISPDGQKVAIGIQNSFDYITHRQPGYGIVRVLDTSDLALLSEHLVADSPKAIAFSADSSTLLIEVKGRGEHKIAL